MDPPREPHSVSLKVLRLSRPSLSQNFPLPRQGKDPPFKINHDAALDYGIDEIDPRFLLSPILTLPPSFGSAYVGETFSCTLCANNELPKDTERQVTSVRIKAEMQSPSGSAPLQFTSIDDQESSHMKLGESKQKMVRFDLREEGSHTLAVNISYSETTMSKDQSASSGRVRTFRKLYQFICRPCLNVRTKVSSLHEDSQSRNERYVVEVQLDNMADGTITLKNVSFNPKPSFKSTSLNWDILRPDIQLLDCPLMAPRDVIQIAFLVELQAEGLRKEITKDGRILLGQLGIQWQTMMGDSGYLTTGWLSTKRV